LSCIFSMRFFPLALLGWHKLLSHRVRNPGCSFFLFFRPTALPPRLPPYCLPLPLPAAAKLLKIVYSSTTAPVHSNKGGGILAHLTLTMDPVAYILCTGITYIPPINPGTLHTTHLAGATGPAITETNKLHLATLQEFRKQDLI
jgi:hypothetical protein